MLIRRAVMSYLTGLIRIMFSLFFVALCYDDPLSLSICIHTHWIFIDFWRNLTEHLTA